MKITNCKRKAISPVIATVILIAITLIAAIAIAGFVFGLFGGFTSGARVAGTASCVASGSDCTVVLSNSGNAGTSVTALSITISGTPVPCTGTTTLVNVGSNTETWTCSQSSNGAIAGSAFTMSVTLANGGIVPISGTFS